MHELYVREVMKEEFLDGESEIALAREIQTRELERWFALLSDDGHADVIDAAILESVEEQYSAGVQERLQPALEQMRTAAVYAEDHCESAGDFERSVERVLQQIAALDSKRTLFPLLYESLNAEDAVAELLHPDTVWRIDMIEACIEQLRHRFIRANLRLVVQIARRFDFGTLPLMDLIQEGNLGLIDAVDRFDHTRGFRFITFATPWIRHAMRKALAHRGQTVRVPARVVDEQFRVQSAVDRFELQYGRAPKDGELAELLEMPTEQLARVRCQPRVRVLSLDRTLPGRPNERPIDLLADDTAERPQDAILVGTWICEKERILSALTSVERSIICWRFGLDGDDELNLRQIGERCNLSKERIRQVQNAALNKLRLAFEAPRAI